jgi:dUTP pyrophosphatase
MSVSTSYIKVYKLYPDVQVPKYATERSACFDIRAYLRQGHEIRIENGWQPYAPVITDSDGKMFFRIEPGEVALIPTGIIFDIEEGFSVRLHSRSGMSLKESLVLANGEGVIDADYVDETFIMIRNLSGKTRTIYHGDRIAQGEVVECLMHGESLGVTTQKPEQKTSRNGGFGHSGKE